MFKRYGRRHNPCPKDICYENPMTGESNMTDKQIKKGFLQSFKYLGWGRGVCVYSLSSFLVPNPVMACQSKECKIELNYSIQHH